METISCKYLLSRNKAAHFSLIEDIFNLLSEDFSKEVRTEVVRVELSDEESFEIRINDLFLSLLLIISRIHDGYTVSRSDFVLEVEQAKKTLENYYDDSITILNKIVPIEDIKQSIGLSTELIAKYMWELNASFGNTVNIIDLIELMRVVPEVRKIINFKVNEKNQYKEINDSIKAQNNRLVEIIKSPDSPHTYLKNMIGSVSIGQFQQVFVNVGLKPNLDETVIPKPINTSFLRGMRDSTDFFINAIGARKALITNSNEVEKAGYLSRKLILLLLVIQLAEDVEDCGPRPLLPIKIDGERTAERYINRYYKDENTEKGKFKLITRLDYQNIVGKEIFVASPITCNLSNEHKICKCCYGAMSDVNPFHKGISNMLLMSEQILQMMLSTKHLLQVISELITLSPVLEKYLEVDKNLITSKIPFTFRIIDSFFNEETEKEKITAIAILDDDENEVEVSFDDLEVFLTEDSLVLLDNENCISVGADENVFNLEIMNNGLSLPLKRIVSLIESGKEMNKRNSCSELVEDILGLLNEGGIRISAVGVEMMVRELARDINDKHLKSFAENNINFLRLTDAVINSPSASISLSFQEYNKLLGGVLFKKSSESVLDTFY